MSLIDRDAATADALLTDLYLDALLAGVVLDSARGGGRPETLASDLDPVARRAADRLRTDLVRVHPSFRFEERLATRLAEAAVAMRMPAAVGAEGRLVPFRATQPAPPVDPLIPDAGEASGDRLAGATAALRIRPDDGATQPAGPRELTRPLLIGGALTSAALSLAGAALVAWRLGRPGRSTPMARAARAARVARAARLAGLVAGTTPSSQSRSALTRLRRSGLD